MALIDTPLTELLGIKYPIIQGGMGPRGTNRLAYEVSNAGGLGTISNMGRNIEPDQAREKWEAAFDRVCSNTDRPFGANLSMGVDEYISLSFTAINETYMETAIRIKQSDERAAERFVVMTTYGGDPGDWNDRFSDVGLLHFAKVTSVSEAEAAEDAGVDAVIVVMK